LCNSNDEWWRGFAAKSLKEISYHVQHSSDWVLRMGDGTLESHARIQKALDEIWQFTGEFFEMDEVDSEIFSSGIGVDFSALKSKWLNQVNLIISEATLSTPQSSWFQTGGKSGRHSEFLGPLLAEMQFLPRAYPDAKW
jgi:ring-1,2-phenylacetyl-CoA epoxidase subunit PaaC